MKFFAQLIFICFFLGCKTSVLQSNYSMSWDKIQFDTANKKFLFMKRGERSFTDYSEGTYSQYGKNIFLHTYSFDSCIKISLTNLEVEDKIVFVCQNYDNRLFIIYQINGINFLADNKKADASFVKNNIEPNCKVIIKVLFPNVFGHDCYNRYDTLSTKEITVNDLKYGKKGAIIKYNINYNYFNWVNVKDSIRLHKNKIKMPYNLDFVHKNNADTINIFNINYLDRCMLPQIKNF